MDTFNSIRRLLSKQWRWHYLLSMPPFASKAPIVVVISVLIVFAVLLVFVSQSRLPWGQTADLGRDHGDFVVQIVVFIYSDSSLTIDQSVWMKLLGIRTTQTSYRATEIKSTLEVSGLPVNSPSFWPKIFCCSTMKSWFWRKTTPRWDTVLLWEKAAFETALSWSELFCIRKVLDLGIIAQNLTELGHWELAPNDRRHIHVVILLERAKVSQGLSKPRSCCSLDFGPVIRRKGSKVNIFS